jgi:SMC interacting uncharacterized protein involved in chromosome segregation
MTISSEHNGSRGFEAALERLTNQVEFLAIEVGNGFVEFKQILREQAAETRQIIREQSAETRQIIREQDAEAKLRGERLDARLDHIAATIEQQSQVAQKQALVAQSLAASVANLVEILNQKPV